jgi:hypothetical protein
MFHWFAKNPLGPQNAVLLKLPSPSWPNRLLHDRLVAPSPSGNNEIHIATMRQQACRTAATGEKLTWHS